MKNLFQENVVETYRGIAHHFHITRNMPWPEMRWYAALLEPSSTIADIGCGTGRNTTYLASLGHNVTGIDIVPEMLSIAEKSIKDAGLEKNVKLMEGDARKLPLEDESVDGVVCVAALHHLPIGKQRNTALQECWRIIKPGGIMLVSVWAREQERYPGFEKLDTPGDVLVPWKRKIDNKIMKRYYYLYTREEFEDIVKVNIGCGTVFTHADNHQLIVVKGAVTPPVPEDIGGANAHEIAL